MSSTVAHETRPSGQSAPAHDALVVAWQHPDERSIRPVGLLRYSGGEYSFRYIRSVLEVPGFRPLLGFPDLHGEYRSSQLFPLFAQRAMDPRRPDYVRYVTHLGLDPSEATPWEQITRSSGRRQGDTLQLFPVPEVIDGHFSCAFLVHGVRHMPTNSLVLGGIQRRVSRDEIERTLAAIEPGTPIELVAEPANEHNSEAVVVLAAGTPLGYVPDLLVHDLQRLLRAGDVEAHVVRVNGPDAPAHLRVVARLTGTVRPGFHFFQDERWLPLD